ncbi:MAG: hypothetical protein JW827_01005 [Spirochaetes bacterium]|nr:hypothetical protein [Spirochaetota bacterium]
MKNLFYIILILVIIFPIPLLSYSYLGISYGDNVGYYGTRNLGMGGTGVASSDDHSALFSNPACLYHIKSKMGASLSGQYIGGNERILDYESPVSYESSFSKFNLNSFGIYVKPLDYCSVAFGYHPQMDFNYESEHAIPENQSEKYGVKYITSEGTADNYSFGLSFNLKSYGSVGLSYTILKGSQSLVQGINYYDDVNRNDEKSKNSYKLKGSAFNMGILGRLVKQIFIGCYLRTGAEIQIENSSTFTYPSQYGLGFMFASLFGYDTVFSLDLLYADYENFSVKPRNSSAYTPAGFHEVFEIHSGVEHILVFGKTKVPVRFGYYFQPFYGSDAYDRSVFTAGLGLWDYPLLGLKMDLSMEFGKRNFLGDNAYFDNTKLIDETLLNFVFGIKYEI